VGNRVQNTGQGQWHLSHALAVIAVVLLIALVTPGCAWLFGLMPDGPYAPTVEPGGGPSRGGLTYPLAAPVVSDAPSLFVAAEPGYRSLGGIFIYDSQLMIIRAKTVFEPTRQNNDLALGLAFGHLVAEHHIDPLRNLAAEDCLGDGDGPETPIQPQRVSTPEDEVAAGIACARLRNPGARWIASKLMVKDRHGVAFVLLQRQDDGEQIGVYTDVTRFVWQGGVLQ
jgi:hypothetical protein